MRNYIVASWNDADQYDYSGEQVGNRQGKSQKVHFNPDGSACVASYADPEPTKKASTIPLADKILPQAKRVRVLTEQMQQLCQEYKQGIHTPEEYTLLLDVLAAKRDRAVELLNKAKNTKPKRLDDEAVSVNQEEENVDFGSDFSTQKAKKKLESCVFLGACVLSCIVMLMMSH